MTVEEAGAELIVMASHRSELRDYPIGPNAARVMRRANASVPVVRASFEPSLPQGAPVGAA